MQFPIRFRIIERPTTELHSVILGTQLAVCASSCREMTARCATCYVRVSSGKHRERGCNDDAPAARAAALRLLAVEQAAELAALPPLPGRLLLPHLQDFPLSIACHRGVHFCYPPACAIIFYSLNRSGM